MELMPNVGDETREIGLFEKVFLAEEKENAAGIRCFYTLSDSRRKD